MAATGPAGANFLEHDQPLNDLQACWQRSPAVGLLSPEPGGQERAPGSGDSSPTAGDRCQHACKSLSGWSCSRKLAPAGPVAAILERPLQVATSVTMLDVARLAYARE